MIMMSGNEKERISLLRSWGNGSNKQINEQLIQKQTNPQRTKQGNKQANN